MENLKQADKAFGDAIADSAWGLLFILFMAFVGVPLIVGMSVCFPVVHLALIRHFQKAYVAEHSFPGNPWFCNWWDISTPKHLDVKKQLKIFAWNSILKVYGLGWLGYGVLLGWIIFAIS